LQCRTAGWTLWRRRAASSRSSRVRRDRPARKGPRRPGGPATRHRATCTPAR
jgi:hypothetical protein